MFYKSNERNFETHKLHTLRVTDNRAGDQTQQHVYSHKFSLCE